MRISIAFLLLFSSGTIYAQKVMWKPQNELQQAAEAARVTMQEDFDHAIKAHYSNLSKEEKLRLVQDDANLDEHVKLVRKFTAVASQAVADNRCPVNGICGQHVKSVLFNFSSMLKTIQGLAQEKDTPETIPLVRAAFDLQMKNAIREIHAIHYKS